MGSAIFWLIVAICAFAIDILTSNFCFVLFSIGAVVAAICGALGVPFSNANNNFCHNKYNIISSWISVVKEKI